MKKLNLKDDIILNVSGPHPPDQRSLSLILYSCLLEVLDEIYFVFWKRASKECNEILKCFSEIFCYKST